MLTRVIGNFYFHAALTDNGSQTCQRSGDYLTGLGADVPLYCIGGYSASLNRPTGLVTYQHGSFSGSFIATTSQPQGYATVWSANVWGC